MHRSVADIVHAVRVSGVGRVLHRAVRHAVRQALAAQETRPGRRRGQQQASAAIVRGQPSARGVRRQRRRRRRGRRQSGGSTSNRKSTLGWILFDVRPCTHYLRFLRMLHGGGFYQNRTNQPICFDYSYPEKNFF